MNALQPLRQTLEDFSALVSLIPAILLLPFLGELLQHIAEIQLGMFASHEAFAALQGSWVRLAFGVIKVAALIVGMALAARWTARRHAVLLGVAKPIDWPLLAIPPALMIAALLAVRFGPIHEARTQLVWSGAILLVSMPALRFSSDALFGQVRQSLAQTLRRHPMPRPIELVAVLPVPLLFYIHLLDHRLAFGASPPLVWALMIWDAALIAVLAAIMGSLTNRFYRPLPA